MIVRLHPHFGADLYNSLKIEVTVDNLFYRQKDEETEQNVLFSAIVPLLWILAKLAIHLDSQ